MKNVANVHVGVDISKAKLDIYLHPLEKKFIVSNDKTGFNKLAEKLLPYQVDSITCEASGGYETQMYRDFKKRGFNAQRVDPRRVKAFIKSEGIRIKTDASDAKMIALFAAQKTMRYIPVELTDEQIGQQALVARKSDLVKMIAAEKTRLQQVIDTYSKKSITKHINFLDKQIVQIETLLAQSINLNEQQKCDAAILKTAPGVGIGVATTLIACCPELGKISNKAMAALAGLAPYPRESGVYKGKSSIAGGRSYVRRMLYMAALSASHCAGPLKEFYDRLIAKGKKPKVALVAVARKLIVFLNAMLRKQEEWKIA